ncbi:MAG: TetR/AcrR family transcriptional regulator [Bacteroidales bacterium]|nr:TetR/AcrR family transcriptional regulator [Bacteroidales bacterium]
MESITEAEIKIMEAAEKVFYQKGKNGASMQDIADEAQITRTSLNYYFRTKDKLFEAVFRNTLSRFVPEIARLIHNGRSFRDYLTQLVHVIIDTMIENPQIPVFVLQELSSNPDRMPQIVKELGIDSDFAIDTFKNDEFLRQLPVDPRHLIMNALSLCIFPFAARSMILNLMYDGNEDAYIRAMKERKQMVPFMIERMINRMNDET